ncbi:hypothetical protein BC833DRAFT_582745 [Globomyces pollinis-pini]|nr:hypothetical protein BC833DRAFT_582745 [Globomyces pollinis-pini]
MNSSHKTMEYEYEALLSKCSICFDNQLDFCLPRCRDQFCSDCFQRYVKEQVHNSWGTVQPISCPVCRSQLTIGEWGNFVDQGIVDMYNHYKNDFRSLTRTCEDCKYDILATPLPNMCKLYRKKTIEQISILISSIVVKGNHIDANGFAVLNRFYADSHIHLRGGNVEIHTIYHKLMNDLERFVTIGNNVYLKRHNLAEISKLLVSLELSSQKWKELQFCHISMFPKAECSNCLQNCCFGCGSTPYHEDSTCIEHMTYILNTKQGTSEFLATLNWKIENSKACPQCKVLINREEGCNKVDCGLCGHKFCWHCLGKFDNGLCGYYRCQLTGLADISQTESEMGVPDMVKIQAKIQSARAH